MVTGRMLCCSAGMRAAADGLGVAEPKLGSMTLPPEMVTPGMAPAIMPVPLPPGPMPGEMPLTALTLPLPAPAVVAPAPAPVEAEPVDGPWAALAPVPSPMPGLPAPVADMAMEPGELVLGLPTDAPGSDETM